MATLAASNDRPVPPRPAAKAMTCARAGPSADSSTDGSDDSRGAAASTASPASTSSLGGASASASISSSSGGVMSPPFYNARAREARAAPYESSSSTFQYEASASPRKGSHSR